MFNLLLRLARRIMRPHEPLVPPPMKELNIPPEEERRKLLDETRLNIRHREDVLRRLEARAKFRGGSYEERSQ